MKLLDVLVIGAGPAGLAAALAAKQNGAKSILLLERDTDLGGILQQCIHTGFGLQTFHEEVTGPEYAQRFIRQLQEQEIPVQCDTMVLDITPDHVVSTACPDNGLEQFKAKAIVLAMGCRERPRGMLGIPGSRCSGIFTAGTAQRFVNIDGYLPGKNIVILGSGDIGLIMARRLALEGAHIISVLEIMPYSAGLKRNVVQCLDDFHIPLKLQHTVTRIHGKERLEAVTVVKVDDQQKPIPGTEEIVPCDTLLISCGLIPENELSKTAGIQLDEVTGGPIVDQNMQTSVPGIFACGNVLHVHDLVDNVSQEAALAGAAAAQFAEGQNAITIAQIIDGPGVKGVVPQRITDPMQTKATIQFRVTSLFRNATIELLRDGAVVVSKKARILAPGNMASIDLKPDLLSSDRHHVFTVQIQEASK